MTRDRSVSIRRLTDDAITLSHPRKSSVCQILFFCSISGPFLSVPTRVPGGAARSRGQDWPQATAKGAREAVLRAVSTASGWLGSGVRLIIRRLRKSSCRIITPQPMRASLLASAQAATLRGLLASNFISQGSSLARLLHNTDIAPLTNSGANSRCRAC